MENSDGFETFAFLVSHFDFDFVTFHKFVEADDNGQPDGPHDFKESIERL